MRWAAQSRAFVGLILVSVATAALLRANIPAPEHIGRLWIVLGWLQHRLAVPAGLVCMALLALSYLSRAVAARRARGAPAAPPARYAHYVLPARAAVALAAAARARR